MALVLPDQCGVVRRPDYAKGAGPKRRCHVASSLERRGKWRQRE